MAAYRMVGQLVIATTVGFAALRAAAREKFELCEVPSETASGPDGDDNGPGSEPPPHDQTFMPSRRRPPAAVGKPSFAYFPVDYLPDDVCQPDEPTDLREQNLPNATSYEKPEYTLTNRRNPGNR
ncbi:hypothetical protein THAOC_04579 [Thalassiosira oceanica]|uniref:Uncharacterized protein n=1 Tax=Thalassiosira oceanica TaxID=159749 RepID=K0T9M0_THAOC|nr:hypothetical protein THAOC_04579 [Thalassiosira oceanica]|eukprot:EJK73779.1 hypothetical protein THAOC_04579 [Thalassiosira oceanica]